MELAHAARPGPSSTMVRVVVGLVLGVAVLVVAGGAMLARTSVRADRTAPSRSFCTAFGQLRPDLARIARVIAEGSDGQGLSLADLRGASPLVWSDHVARGAPPSLRADALVVARAVRRSVADGDASPLGAARVDAAVDRLAREVPGACSPDPA